MPLVSCFRGSRHRRVRPIALQDGVALIEVLISILIFSFGVLGLIGLEATAINVSLDAEDRNRAALFANEIAAAMWLNGSTTLTSAQVATFQANIANSAAGGLPGAVWIPPTIISANQANITITWQAPYRTAADAAANNALSSLTTQVTLP